MIRRVVFERFAKSGAVKTGHRYITRTITMSPGLPGVNCQVFVTFPLASRVKVGAPAFADVHEPATSTSIIRLLQLIKIGRLEQTTAANWDWVMLWACAWPVRISRLDWFTAVSRSC